MKSNRADVPLSKKMGDKLERAGEKVSSSGAHKLGSFISRMGDKLEHSSDPKPDVNNAANPVRKANK